ncbi:MAG: aminotransferase class III-fold pyridoxal phosphate-dependent enzyme [Deltaproteobacteria bacterium]|nr:aminotransferase class III-fold pyridoxal phosphate-dependent enzyme [Deltaproteobacteria bacterium]MBW2303610.1 aminotransferase class III-fold pyridoxal phosphate-dependent enzyme [Deltaproteobacteria bacterium]
MPLLDDTPCFSESEASEIALDLFGIRATASPLPSERDQNFLLEAEGGERYVLKIANAREERDFLETQNQALVHLEGKVPFCPKIFPSRTGTLISEVRSPDGKTHFVRLVSFLSGRPLGQISRHSSDLFQDLGRRVAQLDRALADFDHPGAHRAFHWDLARAEEVIGEYGPLIKEPEIRRLVEQCMAEFERDVRPLLPGLRKSVIHNDANDYNVIVGGGQDLYSRGQRVTGIIDFGDMVYSYTVADLAVALAYAVLDKPDPLGVAAQVVEGYHAEFPLEEPEIRALFGLVKMRLCLSASVAAWQVRQRPEDDYLVVSQGPIRKTLPVLSAIPPRFAEAVLREACGLAPVPRALVVTEWLKGRKEPYAPILGFDMEKEPCIVLDLGVGSPLVKGDPSENREPELTERIFGKMEETGALVGIGRYNEARLYHMPPFKVGEGPVGEYRTVHLGMDLFSRPGTPVHTPLPGIIHAFADNKEERDYGPVVLLRHETSDGIPFFTLYGHLDRESIAGLQVGMHLEAGDRVGTIGTPDVNGGWSPHLHFQIIIDSLDLDCDFPGVCRAAERRVWTAFSPDPNLILRIPDRLFPPPEPTKAETLAQRKKRIGRNLSIGYRDPVKVVRGWMQYLYDETGRKYLDAYNNVPHVGHCHPRVVEAACSQMGVLNTNTRYLHDHINRLAEKLCNTLPRPLSVCFFVNSASEGNELALRLVRAHTKRKDMIVLEAAYHGHTTSLIDISPYKHDGPGGAGAPDWVHRAPIADTYRGPYKRDDPEAGKKYALHVKRIIEELEEKGRGPAGFIAESCPSVGGQIFFPEGYLSEVYRHVRAAGGLCIADEVQTGYGRIGTHFYAFEAQGVVPDIVVLGKPIGNGHPLSAVITTPEIAASFDNGMEFFSTFGGNTVSCAVGLAVLNVVLEEDLQAHALHVGRRMLEGLRPFVERYPIVGDVRGSGLFLGVELVKDRETLEPAGEEAAFIADRMREEGILLGTDGPYHNVVKIRPPMPFSERDADFLVETMEKILREDFK